MAKTTVRKPSTKVNSKTKPKPRPGKTSSSPRSKPAASKSKVKKPPPRQQKPKPLPVPVKKRPTYSEQQLGIPKLNMITPIGVQKSRGKKKGKIFVDDRESMMTILAMVNADKEGHLESKMMKARQLEEIREARRNQQEAKQEAKKSKLEDTKALLRRKRKRDEDPSDGQPTPGDQPSKQSKKKVSFA